jgi:ATPase family associated with various cellular activities (AAA)
MAKATLRFAIGAATPLYLPLYVLRHYKGFNLQADYSISIDSPDKGANGDTVAATQLTNGAADFAICDPAVAEGNDRVRVVATVVGRLAFWAVALKRNINYIEEFADFKTILTYPKGMTGHYLGTVIRKLSDGRQRVVAGPIDTELIRLLDEQSKAVALTANLILARRFKDEHPDYEISPLWTLDPGFSSVMLTGLLARIEDIQKQRVLLRSVVMGLNRSIALLMTDPDVGVSALAETGLVADVAEGRYFVNNVRANRLYPTVLTPELTCWHNLREIHLKGSEGSKSPTPIKPNVRSERTFRSFVDSDAALDSEELTLQTLVQFGKGYLYLDLATSLESKDSIALADWTVVGAYRRAEDSHRHELRRWVERIRKGVVTASTSDENYLIWGTSGSGKSFLVRELGHELRRTGACRFEEINLASIPLADLQQKLAQFEAAPEPLLCLLDEVDSQTPHTTDYTPIFPVLRWRQEKGRHSTFILVGSTTDGVNSLDAEIRGRAKGPDLMRFVTDLIAIPDYTMWDRLAIFVGSAAEEARKTGKTLTAIEKLALYYVAVVAGGSDAGSLSRLAKDAMSRVTSGDHRLMYDHLFDPLTDATARITFTAEHHKAVQPLIDRFLKVS